MEAFTYKLDQFEGPLDLLLTLIQKNKVNISDIPISLICDQYMEYINNAAERDMDIASEFILMASELMLIKSKLLLPRVEEEEEDPRKDLADALLRYQQAKLAATKLAPLYAYYSGRMVKDTDEISVDKTFVLDQSPDALTNAINRIIAYQNAMEKAAKTAFTPMINKPIVPVELKIVGILNHLKQKKNATLGDLLRDAVSMPDLIAIFLGVLELIKVHKIVIDESSDDLSTVHGAQTRFLITETEVSDEDMKGEFQ